ncbi:hypothetical protein C0993_012036, partial [Termitomyces sp. T159_Od127]
AWTRAFSAQNIKRFRTLARARTEQLMDILALKEEAVPLSHWISMWAIDVMGDMAFSGGFETLAAGKDPEGWMDVAIPGQVPWMRDILALAPAPGPILTFQKFAGKKVQETRHKSGELCNDILSIIQNDTEGGIKLTQLQAHADASFIILAGSDTVSEAMTALIRYICADPDLQSQLREEILAPYEVAEGTSEDAFELSKDRLPCLDACIQEALRLVPPVAAGVFFSAYEAMFGYLN